jgi:hypothetical protein
MTLVARDADGIALREDTYYSIGGGFIRREGESDAVAAASFPLPYATAAQLLDVCDTYGLTIAEVARRNEEALRPEADVAAGLDAIWDAMAACVDAGLHADGVLPGMLKVKRRAGAIRAAGERRGDGARAPGVAGRVRAGRQRGERRRWTGRDGADERCRRHPSGRRDVLVALPRRCGHRAGTRSRPTANSSARRFSGCTVRTAADGAMRRTEPSVVATAQELPRRTVAAASVDSC